MLLGGSAIMASRHKEKRTEPHVQDEEHDELVEDVKKVQGETSDVPLDMHVPTQRVPTVMDFDVSRTFHHGIVRTVYNPEPSRLAGTRLDADQQLLIANGRAQHDFVDPFALATDRPHNVESGGRVFQSNVPHALSYSDRNLGVHPLVQIDSGHDEGVVVRKGAGGGGARP